MLGTVALAEDSRPYTLWAQRARLQVGDLRFALLAGLVLLAEAIAILVSSGDRIIGGDGPAYALYARNLVDHGVYSQSSVAPYEPSLYRTPGYPLFLAALRLIGGDSVAIVRIAQFALLGATAYLVYRIAKELDGRTTARVAALLCITYLPFLWLARMHLTETLAGLLLTAIVLLLIQIRRDPLRWRYAAVGGLVGCAALVRPGYALMAVPVIAGMLITRGRLSARQAAGRAGLVAAAFVLVLTPWTVRNLTLTHQVRPFGLGGGGLSLFASAQQYAGEAGYRWDAAGLRRLDAATAPIIERADQQAAREHSDVPLNVRKEIAVDRALRSAARRLAERVPLIDFVKRTPKRIAYLWAVSDYPGTAHYAPWHDLARIQHFALMALALLGCALALRRFGPAKAWPVVLMPAYLTVVHLVSHSEARYSVPSRPALMAFAALGAVAAWDRLKIARRR